MDNDNDVNANANKDEAPPKKYGMMNKADWSMHVGGGGQPIHPVPYTGEAELFGVKLEEGNLEKMHDDHRTICFHLVFDWLLPLIGEDGFYEFVATRMCNYMIQIMRKCAFWPEHYDLYYKKYITANHVACFFGCQLLWGLRGLPTVKDCWSTRKSLSAIGTAKESMPCGPFLDIQ